MRTLASIHHYLATSDDGGVQIHQYATGRVGDLEISTDYPWDGRIEIEVTATAEEPWALSLRVPAWAAGARLAVNDDELDPPAPGYARVERAWRAGDRVTLELPLEPRLTAPHPRVDASRGCLAIERGPLVYCVEEADAPAGAIVDDLRIDPAAELRAVPSPDLLGGIVAVETPGAHEPPEDVAALDGAVPLRAIPYSHWGNRGEGAMRVWIPAAV
jgi:DUF1680 family protein